jgi:predicted small integral membrane protein
MGGACSTHRRNSHRMLVVKSEGTRKHRWADNIMINLVGKEFEDVNCINLIQDRIQWWALVNTVIYLLVS